MSVPYESTIKPVQLERHQYYSSLLETRRSMPVPFEHKGWPNPYKIPHRKSHTAGMLQGKFLEFPRDVFPDGKLNSPNISEEAIWVTSYDEK